MFAAVHVITYEKVVSVLCGVTPVIKNSQEIVILAVNVAYDVELLTLSDAKLEHHGLALEYFLGLLDDPPNRLFW